MTRMWRQQRGIVAVMVVIAILVLLVMAALAIDPGRLLITKSRLQSAVDAAALAAAKIVDAPGADTVTAAQVANQVFRQNVSELRLLSKAGPDPVVTFSNTLNPFVAGTSPPEYVRVIAEDYSIWATFSQLLGFGELSTRASAVAGRSSPIPVPCDLLPVAVCAVPGATAPHWGFPTPGESGHMVSVLKLASGAAGTTFGPGNFQLIRVGGMGADVVRENMAGGAVCAPPGGMMEIDPNPGNVVGPVSQGLNTRFGQYAGPLSGTSDKYPPDKVTTPAPNTPLAYDGTVLTYNGAVVDDIGDVPYSYANYVADYAARHYTHSDGVAERRIAAIPIVDCEHKVPGTSGTLPRRGFACFFLLQPVVHGSGGDSWIFGEFVDECEASGSPGPTPGQGPYKIVLHDDPDSKDS